MTLFDHALDAQALIGSPARQVPARAAVRPPRLAPGKLPPGAILFGPLALVAIWELASAVGWLSPRFLAAPSTAIVTGYDLLVGGTLADHFLASAFRAYLGLGIGEAMKIFLIFTAVLVPVYINTHAALRGIDIRHVELARSVGLSRADFLREVALPGALPGFFTGLRLAVTTCWTALVVLEQINTSEGIGYLMNRARDYGQTDIIVVGLAIYAILGLASDFAVRSWERRALSYRKALAS